MKATVLNRKLHRFGAILVAVPLLLVLGTGILLLLKKDVAWIQPPTQRGTTSAPSVSFERILDVARRVETAGIEDWSDVDRLDVRPSKGIVKVRAKHSRVEVQIDTATGRVLQVAERRSDVIESLHDGSFFHDKVKLFVFLPCATVLLGLWFTGIYLFFLPHWVKAKKRRAARSAQPDRPSHVRAS